MSGLGGGIAILYKKELKVEVFEKIIKKILRK